MHSFKKFITETHSHSSLWNPDYEDSVDFIKRNLYYGHVYIRYIIDKDRNIHMWAGKDGMHRDFIMDNKDLFTRPNVAETQRGRIIFMDGDDPEVFIGNMLYNRNRNYFDKIMNFIGDIEGVKIIRNKQFGSYKITEAS